METKSAFTLEAALLIQRKQVEEWKALLKEPYFIHLKNRVDRENSKLTPNSIGLDVFRGVQIDSVVHNLKGVIYENKNYN